MSAAVQLDFSRDIRGGYGNGASVGHARGSETSLAGAVCAEENAATQRARMLDFHRSRGDFGATLFEVIEKLGGEKSSWSGRRRELVLSLDLVKTKRVRKNPASGVDGAVYVVRA